MKTSPCPVHGKNAPASQGQCLRCLIERSERTAPGTSEPERTPMGGVVHSASAGISRRPTLEELLAWSTRKT